MKPRNMLKICLVFGKSEPQYAYKRYVCNHTKSLRTSVQILCNNANFMNLTLIYFHSNQYTKIQKYSMIISIENQVKQIFLLSIVI